MSADRTFDLASIRARLAATSGRQYWQSLEELADTEAYREFVKPEFPPHASEWLDPVGRRGILKLMGACPTSGSPKTSFRAGRSSSPRR